MACEDSGRHPQEPQVADAVIEAGRDKAVYLVPCRRTTHHVRWHCTRCIRGKGQPPSGSPPR